MFQHHYFTVFTTAISIIIVTIIVIFADFLIHIVAFISIALALSECNSYDNE